mmetsp:Transcript_65258/g.147227  ORF Transcript_65258/g.147227 Transcript_65258/m.147227 type:complete len:168 (+) Transcript_65258:73-576(+)|eukprot:CAMPEP_0197891458 /NCGR_PEP_ID=MMETSP1439-20131203/28594_1 /TAXON_ID=66791 /ORGANISM="Gonyaulax spinifera, Strain CCMP409" /LENGTH=167 /DNA_ID=CAMNT_0043511565 /DNA_START=63 /DNA_END=566 /DNA_ORIENTATION=+
MAADVLAGEDTSISSSTAVGSRSSSREESSRGFRIRAEFAKTMLQVSEPHGSASLPLAKKLVSEGDTPHKDATRCSRRKRKKHCKHALELLKNAGVVIKEVPIDQLQRDAPPKDELLDQLDSEIAPTTGWSCLCAPTTKFGVAPTPKEAHSGALAKCDMQHANQMSL